MRALGYFAFDPHAERGSGGSADSLSRAFDAFCANGNHIAVGCFSDDREGSGRPRWSEMVRTVQESRLGYLVVVPAAEHLGDSIDERIDRVLELDALSCQVVCDDEEYPDPLQNALKRQGGGPASRGERIREGMRAKAAQGLGLGKPPYGYRIDVDGQFRPVEAEAPVVSAMFERYVSHEGGVRSIATWLNDSGHRTRRGQRWSMVTVRDILRNTAYIGTYRRFGLRIPGTYEAIVSTSLFRQVQDRMQSRSPVRRHARSEPFVLSGILYCGHCGQRMMGVTRRQMWRRKDGERQRAEYRYYQCQSRINRSECDYRTTKASDLEEEVLRQARLLNPPAAELSAKDGTAWAEVRRAQTQARLAGVGRRYTSIIERAASGGITLAQLRAAIAEIKASRHLLQERMHQVEAGAEGLRTLLEASRDQLHHGWEGLSTADRQEVLRTLVERVVVKDGECEVVGRVQAEAEPGSIPALDGGTSQ